MIPHPDFLFHRDPESHKGDYAHALLIAGSYGKMGAAILAAKAALRAGIGLLTVHVPRRGVDIIQTALPEAMVSIDADENNFTSLPTHLERYDAIAVGPGIGTSETTQAALQTLLQRRVDNAAASAAVPLVVDADGINIMAAHPEWMHLLRGAVVTPHAREYQRLFADADTQTMADLHDLVIVRKAHHTIIYAPAQQPIVNTTGNAGMATAGSGDVLTGITLSLLAQQSAYSLRHPSSQLLTIQQLTALSVWLHGAAGDCAASASMPFAVMASDIVEALPQAAKKLLES